MKFNPPTRFGRTGKRLSDRFRSISGKNFRTLKPSRVQWKSASESRLDWLGEVDVSSRLPAEEHELADCSVQLGQRPCPLQIEDAHPPLKVLFLSSDSGGGHNAVARAIADKISERKSFDSKILDIYQTRLQKIWPWLSKVRAAAPRVWKQIHRISDRPKFIRSVWKRLLPSFIQPLEFAVEKNFPKDDLDVVVAVHHASAQCLDPLADRLGRRPFTVACLTDYSIHANWIADADLYLVASDTAYERLTRLGKRVEKLQILPCQAPDKVRLKTIDEEYGTIKIVMMMGLEGTSRRKAQRLIGKLLELPVGKRVQIDVICGRNQKLQERFENDYQECPEVTIHGYVDDVPERLKRANLALMRLGCVSMTEALAAGTPVIGFDWHAHEAECLEKLHEIGAGTGSLNPAEAASLVEGFLRNASLRRRWYTQAFKASQSESSSAAAARLILENLRRPASDRSSTSDRSSGVS